MSARIWQLFFNPNYFANGKYEDTNIPTWFDDYWNRYVNFDVKYLSKLFPNADISGILRYYSYILVTDCFEGQMICITLVIITLSVIFLREYFIANAREEDNNEDELIVNELARNNQPEPPVVQVIPLMQQNIQPALPQHIIHQNLPTEVNIQRDQTDNLHQMDNQIRARRTRMINPNDAEVRYRDTTNFPQSSFDMVDMYPSSMAPTDSSPIQSNSSHNYSLRSGIRKSAENFRDEENRLISEETAVEEVEEAAPAQIPPAPVPAPDPNVPEIRPDIDINIALENGAIQGEIMGNGEMNVIFELFGMTGPLWYLFRNVIMSQFVIAIILLCLIMIPNTIAHQIVDFFKEYYIPWIDYLWKKFNDIMVKISDPIVEPLVDGTISLGTSLFERLGIPVNIFSMTTAANASISSFSVANNLTMAPAISGTNSDSFFGSLMDQVLWAAFGWVMIFAFTFVCILQTDYVDHVYFTNFIRMLKNSCKHLFLTLKVSFP